jgi:multiple antibiotic resistance protein
MGTGNHVEIFNFWLTAFIECFTILSPIIVVPAFVGLAGNASQKDKQSLALKSCLIAFGIIVLFTFCGMQLLSSLGITPAALRIAGGLLLFRTGFLLIVSEDKDEAGTQTKNIQNFAVFPMGFPIICGPGALCIVAAAAERIPAQGSWLLYSLVLISAVAVVMTIDFFSMVVAPQIVRVLGKSGIEILKRMVGLLLTMLSTQLAINGITEVRASWLNDQKTQTHATE